MQQKIGIYIQKFKYNPTFLETISLLTAYRNLDAFQILILRYQSNQIRLNEEEE